MTGAGRTHEECAECALETVWPPMCEGHEYGPVACHDFMKTTSPDKSLHGVHTDKGCINPNPKQSVPERPPAPASMKPKMEPKTVSGRGYELPNGSYVWLSNEACVRPKGATEDCRYLLLRNNQGIESPVALSEQALEAICALYHPETASMLALFNKLMEHMSPEHSQNILSSDEIGDMMKDFRASYDIQSPG